MLFLRPHFSNLLPKPPWQSYMIVTINYFKETKECEIHTCLLLLSGWEVRMVKNSDQGLENAA